MLKYKFLKRLKLKNILHYAKIQIFKKGKTTNSLKKSPTSY